MKFVFEILEIMCTLKWTTALIHCPVVMRFFFGKNSVIEIYIDFFSVAWKELLSEGPCSPIVHNSIKGQNLDPGYIWVVGVGKH